MQSKKYTRLLQILGIIVLLIFLHTVKFSETIESLKKIEFSWVIILILFWFVIIFIKAIIWQILVRQLAGVEIPIKFAMVSVVAGISTGSLFPGRVDAARPLMLKKDYGVPLDASLSAVIVEKIFFLISLVIVLLVSSIFFISVLYTDLMGLIYFISLILLLLIVLLFTDFKAMTWLIEKIMSKIPIAETKKETVLNSFKNFLLTFKKIKNRKNLLNLLGLFMFLWIIDTIKIYSVFYALNIEIQIELVAFSYFASTAFGLATLIPGGIGVSEVSQSIIIRDIDESLDLNLINTAILVFRTMYYYSTILLGSVILIALSSSQKSVQEKQTN